jgi:hypothetical protein
MNRRNLAMRKRKMEEKLAKKKILEGHQVAPRERGLTPNDDKPVSQDLP